MNYKEFLRENVGTRLYYEDAEDMEIEIGLKPDELSVGFTCSTLEKFLENFIADKLKIKVLPLLPTIAPIDSVVDLVELATKANVAVLPKSVDVALEIYEDPEVEENYGVTTILNMTPYYSMKALALFDMLIGGTEYDPKCSYTNPYADTTATTELIVAWLLEDKEKHLQLQIDKDMDGAEIIAKLLSKIFNTDVSFVGSSETENIEYDKAKEAAKEGKSIMLTCLDFKMSKAVFEGTQE